ncbi:DUF3085 domain-containing protein [Dactylosporangium salmoneum]|uniref:Uncharacterized protein n=1 Tax=Dactylosporangium salmoneum TaxID=53361 RepID=A0ABP5TCV2_9ACTN
MIRLLFALRDVLALAEHAVAAPRHKPSFIDVLDGTTPTPALWFAGDEGLYLMSNGLPAQPHPTGSNRLHVVHARGYRTAMSKHAVSCDVGGDDFCEPLPLLESQPDGASLHTRLVDAVAAGAALFVIDLDRTCMQIYPAQRHHLEVPS